MPADALRHGLAHVVRIGGVATLLAAGLTNSPASEAQISIDPRFSEGKNVVLALVISRTSGDFGLEAYQDRTLHLSATVTFGKPQKRGFWRVCQQFRYRFRFAEIQDTEANGVGSRCGRPGNWQLEHGADETFVVGPIVPAAEPQPSPPPSTQPEPEAAPDVPKPRKADSDVARKAARPKALDTVKLKRSFHAPDRDLETAIQSALVKLGYLPNIPKTWDDSSTDALSNYLNDVGETGTLKPLASSAVKTRLELTFARQQSAESSAKQECKAQPLAAVLCVRPGVRRNS